MNVLLDTDHVSILHHETQTELRRRLAELPRHAVRVCIVTLEEQARGWLAYLHRARKRQQILKGYSDLRNLLDFYRAYPIMPFDESAMDEFERLLRQRIRIGTKDLRIAAIARANGVELLSRNLRDFRQVPGLDVEDWTA